MLPTAQALFPTKFSTIVVLSVERAQSSRISTTKGLIHTLIMPCSVVFVNTYARRSVVELTSVGGRHLPRYEHDCIVFERPIGESSQILSETMSRSSALRSIPDRAL